MRFLLSNDPAYDLLFRRLLGTYSIEDPLRVFSWSPNPTLRSFLLPIVIFSLNLRANQLSCTLFPFPFLYFLYCHICAELSDRRNLVLSCLALPHLSIYHFLCLSASQSAPNRFPGKKVQEKERGNGIKSDAGAGTGYLIEWNRIGLASTVVTRR